MREDDILDEYGGTDIFQMPVAHIKITKGSQQIRCMRLSPKGLFRWYTECCKTPIGNTLSAGMPFVGVIHSFMDDAGMRDKNLGPVLGYTRIKFAQKTIPPDKNPSTFPIGIILKSLSSIVRWKLQRLNKPSLFFDHDGIPVSPPHIPGSNIEQE